MIRMISASILLTALLFTLPVFADPVPVQPGIPFELAPGQSAEVTGTGFILTFNGILSDSRCPTGVWCFWEGDARAEVTASTQETCVLHTSWQFSPTCPMGIYEVLLEEVAPYPVDGDPPIDPSAYRVTLSITELEPIDVVHEPWGTIKALYR